MSRHHPYYRAVTSLRDGISIDVQDCDHVSDARRVCLTDRQASVVDVADGSAVRLMR